MEECQICGDEHPTYNSNEGLFCYTCLGEHMINSYGHIMGLEEINDEDGDSDSGTQESPCN